MGLDENYHCENPAYICSEHNRRVAGTSPFPPMAPATPPRGAVGASTICDFPDAPPCNLTQQVLMDFIRRSKWKMYQLTSRSRNVANFLTLLDMPY